MAGPAPRELAGELPGLPELAGVHWRPRADERRLRAADRTWTVTTLAHEVPFVLTAALLPLLSPIMLPVGVVALAFAWIIPELYAARGAGVLREPRTGRRSGADDITAAAAQRRALGLLADLVGHEARAQLTATGLVVEPGRLGVWVVGPAGALLARPGGRRVQCYCVHAVGDDLPVADRIAHLLLALREDETGFATVANLTFSGARWRLARRLPPPARAALEAATRTARSAARSRAA